MSSAGPPLDNEFLDALLHKLSQPLTAARGSLELALLFSRTSEDYRKAIQEAMDNIDRMIRIRRTVTELACTGDLCAGAESVSVFSLLLAAADSLGPVAERKRVKLEPSCPDSLYASANPRRLAQAIESCLSAVLGYSPEGSIVSVLCLPRGRDVSISIGNREGAIPPADLPHIFDPFFALATFSGESGAGLALARRVVEAVGGSVGAENVSGGGFRFQVSFPQAEEIEKALVA
jgi:signal transduction histidine kinase